MKLGKLALTIATAATVFTVGCTASKMVSEESLGLRTTNLYTEDTTTADKTMYSKSAAGASTKITRAFENAPPMIPHDVDGMLPITIDNNSCTGCHNPEVAPSMGATPIPKSHFTDFRPATALSKSGKITKEGKEVTNTSDFKTVATPLESLSGTRFNCSQCQTPQSDSKMVPQNTFKSEFRTDGHDSKSNLIDNINEGVK
jgi:cytochrome c-type protein NapB